MPESQLSQLCDVLAQHGLAASLDGPDRTVLAVNTLEEATPDELSFLANPKYAGRAAASSAGAILVADGVKVAPGATAVRCSDPYAAVMIAIREIHGFRRHPQWGRSEWASIHETAQIGASANIGPYVTVGAGVKIGDNCTLYPGSYVGDNAVIGNECTLFPNVVVYDGCRIGHRVTLHSGTVIGQDGLGYAPVGGKWMKIPQAGIAEVGDDVEIGANCAVDRATLGATRVGAGSKFGNSIVIGHGTRVGEDCLFVGLVGVAGSTKIGNRVRLGGHVGVAGHVEIGDDVDVGAKSGVSGNVKAGARVFGIPAGPITRTKRSMIALQKLPELAQRVKELESELEELKRRAGGGGGDA